MTCNNSTFSSNTFFIDGDDGGTRLLVQIADASCTGGVTAGDVIHYDALTTFYVKSKADNPPNSEVFGVVESVNPDASKNVVLYGSINLPSSAIQDIPVGSTGAGGGADIYFLSPDNAGKLRNTIPTELTQIVKPIYQVAPHGNGSYTGIVMNYIGYKVPSDIVVYTPPNRSTPVGAIEYYMSGIISPQVGSNYVSGDNPSPTNNINNQYTTFKNKYPKMGKKYYVNFEPVPFTHIGTFYPMWDPLSVPDDTPVYIHDLNGNEQNPLTRIVEMSKKRFEIGGDMGPTDPAPTTSLVVGQQYFFIKNPEFYGIGGFIVTSIEEADDRVFFPYIENTLRLFEKRDQDDVVISNTQDINYLSPIIKVKNSTNVNTLRILRTDELNTQSFNINNQNLIKVLNDLENRIAVAEQEINK